MGKKRFPMPKDKIELLKELKDIASAADNDKATRTFALALAYLIGDLCPNDRTTKFVFRKNRKVISA